MAKKEEEEIVGLKLSPNQHSPAMLPPRSRRASGHAQVEVGLQREGQKVPNLMHPDVPIGGEDNAKIVRMVGSTPAWRRTPCSLLGLWGAWGGGGRGMGASGGGGGCLGWGVGVRGAGRRAKGGAASRRRPQVGEPRAFRVFKVQCFRV
jgi:hypothetical protein